MIRVPSQLPLLEGRADGAFKREDAIRLGQLPGVQGGLSDRVKKLGEDLSSLGGLVYVWANKDISESMEQVKDDLGKQVTGKPTQSEQERIVEQLDAMIRSLKSEKNESQFAQRDGFLIAPTSAAPSDVDENITLPRRQEQTADRAWQALFRQLPTVSDARLKYLHEVLLQQHFGDQRLVDVSDTPLLTAWIQRPATLRDVAGALPMWGMTFVVSRFPSSL